MLKGQKIIKAFLLDQANIAGLGNIYVDEALFLAKIHPKRSIESLSNMEIDSLHQSIKDVLIKGLENMDASLGNGKAKCEDLKIISERAKKKNSLWKNLISFISFDPVFQQLLPSYNHNNESVRSYLKDAYSNTSQ